MVLQRRRPSAGLLLLSHKISGANRTKECASQQAAFCRRLQEFSSVHHKSVPLSIFFQTSNHDGLRCRDG
jgi:hypothetical protein